MSPNSSSLPGIVCLLFWDGTLFQSTRPLVARAQRRKLLVLPVVYFSKCGEKREEIALPEQQIMFKAHAATAFRRDAHYFGEWGRNDLYDTCYFLWLRAAKKRVRRRVSNRKEKKHVNTRTGDGLIFSVLWKFCACFQVSVLIHHKLSNVKMR